MASNNSPVSLSEIQAEFGGSNPISLSEYYRGGGRVTQNNTSVPDSGTISASDFRTAERRIIITLNTDQQEIDLLTIANQDPAYESGVPVDLYISADVWVWSDDTSVPALTVNVPNANIYNYGIIAGRGGDGGHAGLCMNDTDSPLRNGKAGGTALKLTSNASNCILHHFAGSYIAGGGGGGGGALEFGGGGGGAGGGDGGYGCRGYPNRGFTSPPGAGGLPRQYGANSLDNNNNTQGRGGAAGGSGSGCNINSGDDSGSGGGGGGRALPATTGVNALIPTGARDDFPAGFGGGLLSGSPQRGGDYGYYRWDSPNSTGGNGRSILAAGGGGFWGKKGGSSGGNSGYGGAGGKAIDNESPSFSTATAQGNIYGYPAYSS